MRLSDYKNEEAIDVLADLIEPASKIIGDAEVRRVYEGKGTRGAIIKTALKNQKKAVVEFVAYLHREDPETFEFTIPTLLNDLLDVINDPEVAQLFILPDTGASSGSATPNTEAKEH